MFQKIIVALILVIMIISTILPAFAFAQGQMEPEGRTHEMPSVETMEEEPVTTGFTEDYSQKKEIVLNDLLRVYPDTVSDPNAIVVGYNISAVNMPVTFPFSVLVSNEKDTYNASELGLAPVLWDGTEYVTKAWVGTKALDGILGSDKKQYFSNMNGMRFIIPN